jgi:hypothetical protein
VQAHEVAARRLERHADEVARHVETGDVLASILDRAAAFEKAAAHRVKPLDRHAHAAEQLARLAIANGITQFEANVLPENIPMLRVFSRSGLRLRERKKGVVRVTLFLTRPPASPIPARTAG